MFTALDFTEEMFNIKTISNPYMPEGTVWASVTIEHNYPGFDDPIPRVYQKDSQESLVEFVNRLCSTFTNPQIFSVKLSLFKNVP